MSIPRQPEENGSQHFLGHRSVRSRDTNASGIADSTISFNGTIVTTASFRLSEFPNPPVEIPPSPIQSEQNTPSPNRSNFTVTPPITPRHKFPRYPWSARNAPSIASSSGSNASDITRFPGRNNPPQVASSRVPAFSSQQRVIDIDSPASSSHVLSPYDWHEGSSSIDVDATEDRLLSTSFITSLLREESDHHTSTDFGGSDGASSISQLTYPPSSRYPESVASDPHFYPPTPLSSTPFTRNAPPRPLGARPPPSAFTPIIESDERSTATPSRSSDDSVTLAGDNHNVFVRTASLSKGFGIRGASVVGVAPARTVSINKGTQFSENHQFGNSSGFESKDGDFTIAKRDENMGHGISTSSMPLRPETHNKTRHAHHSTISTISRAPSFKSRISSRSRSIRSIGRAFTQMWTKPLPPVPRLPDMTIAAERELREAEERMPLPELISRARALEVGLEKGYHPYDSLESHSRPTNGKPEGLTSAFDHSDSIHPGIRHPRQMSRGRHRIAGLQKRKQINSARTARRIIIVVVCCMVVLAVAIGVGVGVGIRAGNKQKALPICSGNLTGNACNLDATCVCTSSSGQCDQLANSLISLVPQLNEFFSTNFTAHTLQLAVWSAQGSPTGVNCARQSLLVDVAPALDSDKYANRTLWAQTALLWNLAESQDLSSTAAIQKFILNADWKKLGNVDGPVADSSSQFQTVASGFTFDFAAQTVTQQSVSFLSDGQPSSVQIAQVGNNARAALDRMYSFAFASSTQQQQTLETYWSVTLQQNPQDLRSFISLFSGSPILLPFDATLSTGGSSLATLLTNSSSAPFPPPLACYPGLSATQLQRINTIETQVFGLSSAPSATQFDTSCFPDRPIYGVLDVLRLRLPFIDSRTGVAKQAAVLTRDVAPRAVIYPQETLSALLNASSLNNLTALQTNPRQYGTLNHLNHIILDYLSSIPDVNDAIALVEYVLTNPAVPPTNSTNLPQSLTSLPVLEAAVFGSILPSDISYTVSSFSTPSGSLYFGSDEALAMRNWAIEGTGTSVVWAENATSAQVVRDTTPSNTIFNEVWTAASTFLHNNVTGVKVDVSNITTSFRDTGMFSP